MKLLITILIGANILFANSIVGSWSMNKSSANRAINQSKSELRDFLLLLLLEVCILLSLKKVALVLLQVNI